MAARRNGLTAIDNVTKSVIKLTKTQRIAIQASFEILNNTKKQLDEITNQFELAKAQLAMVMEEVGVVDFGMTSTYQITAEDELVKVS